MRRDLAERTCDQCNKSDIYPAKTIGGGTPWYGWVAVQIAGDCSSLRPSGEPWDFCCTNCAISYLAARKGMEDRNHA